MAVFHENILYHAQPLFGSVSICVFFLFLPLFPSIGYWDNSRAVI